ncbi:hypothetical protein MP213Fo_01170 [Pseudochrobactrum sp. MP213Fo]
MLRQIDCSDADGLFRMKHITSAYGCFTLYRDKPVMVHCDTILSAEDKIHHLRITKDI